MSTTPYMNLLLPDPTITPGPTYATENNSAFGVIDAHDHTTGKGVKVPSAGININGDLTFGDFNATNLRSLRLTANISPLGTVSDLGCVYRSGVDLWYNDGNGVQIQLTAGGGLNAASIGAIGGDYTTSTASVFYTSASKTFSFTQDTNKAAAMDFGPFTFRRESLSAPGITMQPDVTLVSDYTMTWPGSLPASTSLMQVSNTGAISFLSSIDPDDLVAGPASSVDGGLALFNSTSGKVLQGNSNFRVLSDKLRIYDPSTTNYYGISQTASPAFDLNFDYNGTAKLSLDASLNALSGLSVLSLRSFTTLQLDTAIASGDTPDANTQYANTICKAWGVSQSGGSLDDGVGLSVSKIATGHYRYVFARAMASANYAVAATMNELAAYSISVTSKTTGQFDVRTYDSPSASPTDGDHSVIVFGDQ